MSTINREQIDPINWIENAISKNYLKYYDYTKFTNQEEISSGSSGKIFLTRRKDSDTVMVLKDSYNLTIKEIVNELTLLHGPIGSC
ncbi:hypothetical protein C1645_820066 [Glomus cerebriforme]|uniref:Protein kinase domain-containing protein n=1 Tax=Glomus cerebriforme TaxID=658196 RepID=A0A397T931_9GLOM|nr:hypothetical protein C1645_820066 [Glomus cerebriforme]